MGKLTRYRGLPDQAYDPRVTDLRRPFNVPAGSGPQAAYIDPATGQSSASLAAGASGQPYSGWTNKNVTNMIPFLLIAGVSVRALPNNPKRCGLEILNKDAATTINYSFSNDLQLQGLAIGPGGAALYDFTTPPDALYLIAGATNVQVVVLEISRMG
jgi:hypothetical protein